MRRVRNIRGAVILLSAVLIGVNACGENSSDPHDPAAIGKHGPASPHSHSDRPTPSHAQSSKPSETKPPAKPTKTTPVKATSKPAEPPQEAPARPSFAGRRIIAYYGAGSTAPGMGVLGQASPEQAWARLQQQTTAYDRPGSREPMPAFELIATVAQADPGADGTYRVRQPDSIIAQYLSTVRRHHGILILDVQPGRSDFPSEARSLEHWLRQPDVQLAIDPEWRMAPGQIPAQQIGSVSAAEINATSAWLDSLVRRYHLPQKLFLIHKFRSAMLQDEPAIRNRPNLYEVVNMDGFGSQGIKIPEYRQFAAAGHFPMGLKLFYQQDTGLMTPAQAVALKPEPMIVDYQ